MTRARDRDEGQSGSGRRFGRLAGIVAVFVLLGPPLGTLGGFAFLGLRDAAGAMLAGRFGEAADTLTLTILGGFLFALPLAYAIGGFQACVTGAAVAAWDFGRGKISPAVAVTAALAAWLAASIVVASLPGGGPGSGGWQGAALTAHVFAAVACCFIARALFGRKAA